MSGQIRFALIRSRFAQYGNGILAAIVLVTCPCELLSERLQSVVHRSMERSSEINWLNIIRPDWFDGNHALRPSVHMFFSVKKFVETRVNECPMDSLAKLVLDNAELSACRLSVIHLLIRHERWDLIHLFAKYHRDWSFLTNLSVKVNMTCVWNSRIVNIVFAVTRMDVDDHILLQRIPDQVRSSSVDSSEWRCALV